MQSTSVQRAIRIFATVTMMTAIPGHAQFLGILGGATSIFTQITGKIGNKITGGESATDIQVERDKYFSTMEQQLAGVDPASKPQLMATFAQQWSFAESAILMRNAQAQRQKDAPLVDMQQVLKDSLGGFSAQVGMAGAFGNASVMDVLGSSTLDGIISGVSGNEPAKAGAMRARGMQVGYGGVTSVAGVAGAAMTSAVAGGVSSAVNGAVTSAIRTSGSDPSYKFPAVADPLSFFGKTPNSLVGKDLYRENGFIGWKRIDGSLEQGAEAYAPVSPDSVVKAAVFNFDKSTGSMKAAFRVLAAPPSDFTKVVEGLDVFLGIKGRYASTGASLRAIWPGGAFVTADTTRLVVGWSDLVSNTEQGTPVAKAQ